MEKSQTDHCTEKKRGLYLLPLCLTLANERRSPARASLCTYRRGGRLAGGEGAAAAPAYVATLP